MKSADPWDRIESVVRRLLVSAGVLIAATALNLGIAHSAYLWSFQRTSRPMTRSEALMWVRAKNGPETDVAGSMSSGIGWTYWRYGANPIAGDPMSRVSWDHATTGFPLRCFAGDGGLLVNNSPTVNAWRNLPNTSATRTDAVLEILRWRPIWPAFAANTAIYAAGVIALVWGPRQARRCFRLRRGLCPHCGYPRGSHTCPECGTPHVTKGSDRRGP